MPSAYGTIYIMIPCTTQGPTFQQLVLIELAAGCHLPMIRHLSVLFQPTSTSSDTC